MKRSVDKEMKKQGQSAAEWWKANQIARNWPLTLEEMFQFAEMYADYRVNCVLNIYSDLEHEADADLFPSTPQTERTER